MGNVANNFKRNNLCLDIIQNDIILMYAVIIAEFGCSFSSLLLNFLFHSLISAGSTFKSKNFEYILKPFESILKFMHIFGNNFCSDGIIFYDLLNLV